MFVQELGKENLPFFPMKGQTLASYYPNPDLRTMGDIDVVVDNREKAETILLNQGYICVSKMAGHEWKYDKESVSFELHDSLIVDDNTSTAKIESFLNKYDEYRINNCINISYHFVYVLIHLRKHLIIQGVGFRQFLDIAMLIKNCNALDWVWIEQELKNCELLSFARNVFSFIEHWWGVVCPIGFNLITEDFYKSGTDFVLANGVFGFNNAENKANRIANAAIESKRIWLSKLYSAVSFVFPNYRSLSVVKPYNFIEGKPYLLPFAWIYRFYVGIKNKKIKRKINSVKEEYASNDYIDKRKELYKQWGLSLN